MPTTEAVPLVPPSPPEAYASAPPPPGYAATPPSAPPYGAPAYAPPPPGAFPPGVAPPPPNAGGGKSWLKPVLIIVAIVAVIGIVAAVLIVALDDSDGGTAGNASSDSYDIELTRCSQNGDGDPIAGVEVTNTSGETKAFKVQVGFFSGDEAIGSEVFDSTGSLDDGESSSLEIVGFTVPSGDFTCRVTAVSDLGS